MDSKGIARALREQLKAAGLVLSQAQALEVVAKTGGHRNWNTLLHSSANKSTTAAEAPDGFASKGRGAHYCPQCGKADTISVMSSAYVEQGEYVGSSYEFEGDADHYECNSCGYQFLDWQSDAVNGTKEEVDPLTMDSALEPYGITLGSSNDKYNGGTWEWYQRSSGEYRNGFATKAEAYRAASTYVTGTTGDALPPLDEDDELIAG